MLVQQKLILNFFCIIIKEKLSSHVSIIVQSGNMNLAIQLGSTSGCVQVVDH